MMVIDSARSVEAQPRKLCKVCRRREIPIFTFVNKLDRLGREPFDNLHEVEEGLGIRTCPITWPLGQGQDFTGGLQLFDADFRRRGGDGTAPGKVREEAVLLEAAARPFA